MSSCRIGLTGGIAAGKSTVADWLSQAGFEVVDADQLVARLYQPDREGSAVIARLLGSDYLTDDGRVDHRRVADRVFSDDEVRRQLETAIHPLVKREFEAIASQTPGVVVLEAPLLVEAGFATDFDLVITVEANPATRLQRAISRGLEPAEAKRRMAAQSSEATRTAAADRVVRNDGSLRDLHRQVAGLVAEIKGIVDNEP